ncbi:MAG: hypothetical protein JXB19_01435 [Bacteroidales bacterium]|nr:hypothetical protein [Bacteroidales bacterium]
MISLHNILSIARYERKTLFRSWFFRIFSSLSMLVLFIVNFALLSEAGMSRWVFSAIPSTIPYFNLLILNVAQAIIAVFLASDFLKRDKKLDTTEVIYMRPMTNAEYVVGKTWGNIEVFLLLNILILGMALVFNLLAPGAAVNWVSYALYLLLISIPTLVFIIGLSFLIMSVIQNQAVTFVLILGYIGITLFLLQEKFYYLFDYMAFKIPLLQSQVTGFGNLPEILLHRGIYFSLGVGCVFMTMYILKRLPQSESMTLISLIGSILFIIAGFFLGYKYISNFKGDERLRKEMVELNNQYFREYTPEVIQHDLQLSHTGEQLEVESEMLLQNNSANDLGEIILHLNPGLQANSITIEGQERQFERKHHLLIIGLDPAIEPGEEIRLSLDYSGKVNEAACYLDIDREEREEMFGDLLMNADKRYAFVTPNYVLLTPEANWYPVPGVSYSTEHVGWDKRNYTDYTLHVTTGESLVAISQGVSTQEGSGNFLFRPEQSLTQISLTIGNYEEKSFEADNIRFSLWHFKGHDYFSDVLTDINDTVPNLIAGKLNDLEREFDLTYAFNRISVVEVPAQFKSFDRIWRSYSEYVQPEQVYMPEKAYQLSDADFRFMIKRQQRQGRNRDESLTDRDYQLRVVNNFMANFTDAQQRPDMMIRIAGAGQITSTAETSPYYLFPQLYNFQNDIRSDKWPVMNRIFEYYLRSSVGTDMRSSFMRNITGSSGEEDANIALQDKSFVEILTDLNSKDIIPDLISLKSQVFFVMLQSQTSEEVLGDFLKAVLVENRFKNLSFEEFENKTQEHFGIELGQFVENWFNQRELPKYLISSLNAVKVKTGDQLKTMVSLKVSNLSDVDGVILLSFRLSTSGGMPGSFGGGMSGGGRGSGGFGGSSNVDEQVDEILYLEANQTKEFSFLLPSEPRMADINTLTSENIPQTLSNPFSNIVENTKITAYEGERISETPVNLVLPGEIIVDNEDPGFQISTLTNTSLLRKWLIKEDESAEKYSGVNQFRPPASWTATTSSDFYGHIVRSAYYIKSGDGNQKATWTVPIDEPGYYDVYYYVYNSPMVMRGGFTGGGPPVGGDFGGRGDLGRQRDYYYYFNIFHDEGEEEQILNVGASNNGWVLLGSYQFSSGDGAVIQLSNKSEQRIVYADAIKLVKL